jgi:hypothetical protein
MRRFYGSIGLLVLTAVGLTLLSHRGVATDNSAPASVADEANLPSVVFSDAPQIQITGVDSNSPAHWDGDTLYVFNSYGHPWRNSGPDIFHLGNRISTRLG